MGPVPSTCPAAIPTDDYIYTSKKTQKNWPVKYIKYFSSF